MTTLEETTSALWRAPDEMFDEAQLAAVAFLARYSGRILDAYRHDLRAFFQWATDKQLVVLKATRPHIELYRAAMEERGLAASTIDRRLSTVCGFYRFAHIDGRISANAAQYVRRPKVPPSEGHGMDRAELGTFCASVGPFDRQARRTRNGPSAHAAGRAPPRSTTDVERTSIGTPPTSSSRSSLADDGPHPQTAFGGRA